MSNHWSVNVSILFESIVSIFLLAYGPELIPFVENEKGVDELHPEKQERMSRTDENPHLMGN